MISSFSRFPALSKIKERLLLEKIKVICLEVESLTSEWHFYIDSDRALTQKQLSDLQWILKETFEPDNFGTESSLSGLLIEIGPRLQIVTPYSTNAVSICKACGLDSIIRIERARRYSLKLGDGAKLSGAQREKIIELIRDRMTEEEYPYGISTFDPGITPGALEIVPLLEKGMYALVQADQEYGLSLGDQAMRDYVFDHFVKVLKRNPTIVELFKFAQLNSEHCRHNIFNGRFYIDGQEMPKTLFSMIKKTVEANPINVVLAFEDNAAAIKGFEVETLIPASVTGPAAFQKKTVQYCLIFKVETHNYPTGVCAYPGAATGTGGEIRDRQAQGRAGLVQAGIACYFVGALHIPAYRLSWEKEIWQQPRNLQTPLEILIEASNGASDYSNCFGQPLVIGSTRSFEMALGSELIGYPKPVMVAGGVGLVDKRHAIKQSPEEKLLVVQIGGDAYPVGFGGASVSSSGSGVISEELEYDAVQRANPEMEQRDERVIRACSRLGDKNPIVTLQDLGAGGTCTGPTELVDPIGARLYLRRIPCGDKTMAVLVYYCNEAQERHVMLIHPKDIDLFKEICLRERCPMSVIGYCTNDGKIRLEDEWADENNNHERFPVELSLDFLLGKIPQKVIDVKRVKRERKALKLPKSITVEKALEKVLKLLQVGSKHFLTRKADRSVGGLITQQQTVGPLQVTLSDYALVADSHFGLTGKAISIGDQPIKGVVKPEAGGRMSVAEALTNLAFVKIDGFDSINFSGTWQWPCGHSGEDAAFYDTVKAVTDLCLELGLCIPVGKDSLSMTAKAMVSNSLETVKAPGTLEIVAMAPCFDITKKVTSDIKMPGQSRLMFIDLAKGKKRLGGSCLAQVYGQVGDQAPDVEDTNLLRNGYEAIQEMLDQDLILAGHDRSEGGLIITLLEMAFAGKSGLDLHFNVEHFGKDIFSALFNEESGFVVEYLSKDELKIRKVLNKHGLKDFFYGIGRTTEEENVELYHNGRYPVVGSLWRYFRLWQETSYQIDMLQANPICVKAEKASYPRKGMKFDLLFKPEMTPASILEKKTGKPRVAILREEGTNGDQEMVSAFWSAGFEPWDVTMTDLASGKISLKSFKGIAFCGGFSFADVLDAGKGWAAVIKFNQRVAEEFEDFFARGDTFSFGVCNGCQVMALLGIVPGYNLDETRQPRFIRNTSEIFESRFVAVKILPSPSIFLKGMEDSVLGVWVAHSEGRLHTDSDVKNLIIRDALAPMRFVDDKMEITEYYPYNPNGSDDGITALISSNGRHLAMMPHPERLFLKWQWPYWPKSWSEIKVSPWLKLFQNAYAWCGDN